MHRHVRKLCAFCMILLLFGSIDQISGRNNYEINEGYPISVRDIHFKTRSKVDSQGNTISAGAQNNHTMNSVRKGKTFRNRTRHSKTYRSPKNYQACAKCPREITVIAREGLDGVLIEPPAPLSCRTNLPFSAELFRMETLFGPDFGAFVLPRGRHSLVAKIRNVETGLVERSCLLKYNVIVPKCQTLPRVKNSKLKMFCTAHTVWGSKCGFQCKNIGEYISHREPLVCNEDLEWIGNEPDCVQNDNVLPTSARHNYEINKEYPIAVRDIHFQPEPNENSHNDIISLTSPNNHMLNSTKKTKPHQKKTRQSLQEAQLAKNYQACTKCPREITVIAREGLDGVLLEPPAPLSCRTNLPFSAELFRIETLFGPDFDAFVLPRGRHSLVAKIRNVETGLVERSCLLKYNVIVPKCQTLPRVKNSKLKMFCTAHTVWGSKCGFQCKNIGEYISHHEPLVCNEDLEWIGNEPDCVENDIPNEIPIENAIIPYETSYEESCMGPKPIANGKFVCSPKNGENTNHKEKFPPGTKCHVQCDHLYSIPIHWRHRSVIECRNGHWSLEDIEFCYRKEPRRLLLR